MTLRLVGLDHYRGTRPGAEALWLRGEARDVPDETATYLLSAFPGAWEATPSPVVAPAMTAPPMDRKVRSPRGR